MAGRNQLYRMASMARGRLNPVYRYGALRGDPGFLGSLGKIAGGIVGKVAPKVLGAIPGVGTALSIGSLGISAVKGIAGMRKAAPAVSGLPAPLGLVTPGRLPGSGLPLGKIGVGLGAAGAAAYGGSKIAGHLMGGRRRYRRMNPLNPKAANRAIRRIKAVRKLCRTIESSLPKKASPRSCAPRFGRKR